MITLFKETRKKVTLEIIADKESKYYLEYGDIKQFDETMILSNFDILCRGKKKGLFTIKLTAITERQRLSLIKQNSDWVNRTAPKERNNAGVLGTLYNKGYR